MGYQDRCVYTWNPTFVLDIGTHMQSWVRYLGKMGIYSLNPALDLGAYIYMEVIDSLLFFPPRP